MRQGYVFGSYLRVFLKNILKACFLQNAENATVKIEIYFEIQKGLLSSSLLFKSCMILQFCFLTQTLVNLIYLNAILILKSRYILRSNYVLTFEFNPDLFLRRNLALAPRHTKEVAYKTLVRPQLEYAAPIWHPYHETQIAQVEKVQRTAARWTCRRWRNTSSVGDKLDELEWPSLEAHTA